MEEKQMLGQVKWFTDVGGYGFIERSDVEFELVEGAHGPQAANVIVRPRTRRGDS